MQVFRSVVFTAGCKVPAFRRFTIGILGNRKFGHIWPPGVGCSARRYPCPPCKGSFGISLLYWLFARQWQCLAALMTPLRGLLIVRHSCTEISLRQVHLPALPPLRWKNCLAK